MNAATRFENLCDCGRPKVGGAIACSACYAEARERRESVTAMPAHDRAPAEYLLPMEDEVTKWTPGPWKQESLRVETRRGIIAECPTPQKGGVFDCEANARLISAAPDMAEALRKAEQLADICGDWNLPEAEIDGEMVNTRDLRDEFRAALRKAHGG